MRDGKTSTICSIKTKGKPRMKLLVVIHRVRIAEHVEHIKEQRARELVPWTISENPSFETI